MTEQRQAITNLSVVLEEAGSSLRNVVKVNVFLTTMDNFASMNEAYDEFFSQQPKPVGYDKENRWTDRN
jgi:2-iminobutanoate/2-iminopropanoate deaminase